VQCHTRHVAWVTKAENVKMRSWHKLVGIGGKVCPEAEYRVRANGPQASPHVIPQHTPSSGLGVHPMPMHWAVPLHSYVGVPGLPGTVWARPHEAPLTVKIDPPPSFWPLEPIYQVWCAFCARGVVLVRLGWWGGVKQHHKITTHPCQGVLGLNSGHGRLMTSHGGCGVGSPSGAQMVWGLCAVSQLHPEWK